MSNRALPASQADWTSGWPKTAQSKILPRGEAIDQLPVPDTDPRQPILSNFRVLARTNMILRTSQTQLGLPPA